MKPNYTPGLWIVKPSESKPAFNVTGSRLGGKYKIARCPYVSEFDKAEAEANANLIAAAPELLKACEMMLWAEKNGEYEAQIKGKPRYSERVEILRNVIAKATGEKENV